jgi:hypothetical protein
MTNRPFCQIADMKLTVSSKGSSKPIDCSLLNAITERHEFISRSNLVKYGQLIIAALKFPNYYSKDARWVCDSSWIVKRNC